MHVVADFLTKLIRLTLTQLEYVNDFLPRSILLYPQKSVVPKCHIKIYSLFLSLSTKIFNRKSCKTLLIRLLGCLQEYKLLNYNHV